MAERPNIVIIMTDQQRGDFLRSNGFALDTMPFMDSLGSSGASFAHAYTPIPVCAPARCSLFTGRFPRANRVVENGAERRFAPPTDLVKVLRGLGYSINLCGKNHSHLVKEDFDFLRPYGHHGATKGSAKSESEDSFDKWLATLQGGSSDVPAPFPIECQLPHRIVRDAIECVRARDQRPFFLWMSFPEPHNPYQAPQPYYDLFPEDSIPDRFAGPEAARRKGPKWRWELGVFERKQPGSDENWRRYRANYCGMIRLIDDQIKRFVEYLTSAGVLRNTLIVFTSDHGDYTGDYGLQRKGVEVPECLMRVPLVFSGPGIVTNRFSAHVSLVDIFPTICESIGVPLPETVQGRSLWPLLTGGAYPKEEFRSIYGEMGIGGLHYSEDDNPPVHFPPDGPFIDSLNCMTQSGAMSFVRMGDWKLAFDMMGRGQLYNIARDPGELEDLYGNPAFAAERTMMLEELLAWSLRASDALPRVSYVAKRDPRNWYAPYR